MLVMNLIIIKYILQFNFLFLLWKKLFYGELREIIKTIKRIRKEKKIKLNMQSKPRGVSGPKWRCL